MIRPFTEFQRQTGLDARKDVKIGDYSDAGFRKWIEFRIQTITDFVAEMRSNAIAVNPSIAIIPEVYPGIEAESPRVGADVYQLYPQVDAIAHEYEFGDGEITLQLHARRWIGFSIKSAFAASVHSPGTSLLGY